MFVLAIALKFFDREKWNCRVRIYNDFLQKLGQYVVYYNRVESLKDRFNLHGLPFSWQLYFWLEWMFEMACLILVARYLDGGLRMSKFTPIQAI